MGGVTGRHELIGDQHEESMENELQERSAQAQAPTAEANVLRCLRSAVLVCRARDHQGPRTCLRDARGAEACRVAETFRTSSMRRTRQSPHTPVRKLLSDDLFRPSSFFLDRDAGQ